MTKQNVACLHEAKDHGYLGCNTCGCPRSEDAIAGTICQWPAPENYGRLPRTAIARWDNPDVNPLAELRRFHAEQLARHRAAPEVLGYADVQVDLPEIEERPQDLPDAVASTRVLDACSGFADGLVAGIDRTREDGTHGVFMQGLLAAMAPSPPIAVMPQVVSFKAEPWSWHRGDEAYPHGLAIVAIPDEPGELLGDDVVFTPPRLPEADVFALGEDGERIGPPLRVIGPFVFQTDEQGPLAFRAEGGHREDYPRLMTFTNLRVTPYREDGTLGEPVELGSASGTVTFEPESLASDLKRKLADLAPTIGQLGKAFLEFCAPISRATLAMLTGWARPGGKRRLPPVRGLTRRQRAAQRRRKRRKA